MKSKTIKKTDGIDSSVIGSIINEYFGGAADADSQCSAENPFDALYDLQPLFVRVGVLATHAYDLIEAKTPDNRRALAMLQELEFLSKDGMNRLKQAGVEF